MKTIAEIQAWIDKHVPDDPLEKLDLEEDQVGWFISCQEAQFATEWMKESDHAWVHFAGVIGYRENPKVQQEWLDLFNERIQEDLDSGLAFDEVDNIERRLNYHFGINVPIHCDQSN